MKPKGINDKESSKIKSQSSPDNLKEQAKQGNIYQNTHNQGYQQDR